MYELYDLRENFLYYNDFYLTAKEKSYSEASRKHNISQSSLTRSISKLENLLDLKLVNTSNKGFELYNTTPTVKLASYMLKDELNNLGINALVEERPVIKEIKKQGLPYHYSYDISNKYCKEIKEKYPSIIYFIDLHRDSATYEMTTCKYEGKSYAKILFVLGMEFESYGENEKMINYLNEKLKSINPCLSRGVSKKSGKGVNGIYNEDFDKNLILIEVGGQYNNIIEVSNTLEIFAKILSLYINEDNNEKT